MQQSESQTTVVYQLRPDATILRGSNGNSMANSRIMTSTDPLDFESRNGGELNSSHRRRIIQTVVDLIVIVIIFAIFGLVYGLFAPKVRFLTCDQSDIFFPYIKDTIPFWAVGIYATVGPALFIIAIELLNARLLPFQNNKFEIDTKSRLRKFFVCAFHGLSLFALGIALTLCLTEIGKRWVGRLRPHFIDVCKPKFDEISCTTGAKSGVVYNAINTGGSFCTGEPSLVEEARLSFPSGHASYSTFCMLFLIIFVEARLILLKLRYIKPLIQLAAFAAAFVTSLSRISDYHHRGTDVIGGASLGAVIALFITLVVGRVLWTYEIEKRYVDFDQKPNRPITRQF